jgi:hypothetical protein
VPVLTAAERFIRGREAEEQRAALQERLDEIAARLASLERRLPGSAELGEGAPRAALSRAFGNCPRVPRTRVSARAHLGAGALAGGSAVYVQPTRAPMGPQARRCADSGLPSSQVPGGGVGVLRSSRR